MATTSEALFSGKFSVPDFIKPKRRKMRPATTQRLWKKLEGDASLLALSAHRPDLSEQERLLIEQCQQKLEQAKDSIDRPFRRSFSFWELIHEVDALLLLVLPVPLLATQALEVMQKFDKKVSESRQRELWLGSEKQPGPLRTAVQLLVRSQSPTLDGAPGARGFTLSPEQLSSCRYTLYGALSLLDEQVDQGFWQLSTNVSLQVLSALLLLVFGLLWWTLTSERMLKWLRLGDIGLLNLSAYFDVGGTYFGSNQGGQGITDIPFIVLLPFVMLGAAGAIVSNMLSKEPFVITMGATARGYVYYLFVKPLIGAFAALFLLFIERSDVLLSLVLILDDGTRVSTASRAAIQIVVHSVKAAVFTLAMLSVTAGFSADKLLSSMVDRALGLLFEKSEKQVATASEEKAPLLPSGKPPSGNSTQNKEMS